MPMTEVMQKATEMGYDVHGHGGSDGGHAQVPDLSDYMDEIADDFASYLEKELPGYFQTQDGEENFMDEERLSGIVAEV
jgi:hypothetical protein